MSETQPEQTEQPADETNVSIEGAEQVVVNTAPDGGGQDGDVEN